MGSEWALLFGAALLAGGINAIAGGGGLIVFPALLLTGISPISANATSSAGIWIGMVCSGVAYRAELSAVSSKLWPVTLVSLAGAALGAWLLLNFSDDDFAGLVPYLVGLGTVLFALAPKLTQSITRSPVSDTRPPNLNQPLLLAGQGLISTYGGFFGGGAGILMLTLLSLTNPSKLPTLQAVRIWLAICINAMALSYFVLAGIITWPYALLVATGTSLGGCSSVYIAKKIPVIWLRRLVIAIGSGLTVYFFFTH